MPDPKTPPPFEDLPVARLIWDGTAHRVFCRPCSARRLDTGVPIWRTNIWPYRASCAGCGALLVEGASRAWPDLYGGAVLTSALPSPRAYLNGYAVVARRPRSATSDYILVDRAMTDAARWVVATTTAHSEAHDEWMWGHYFHDEQQARDFFSQVHP